MDVMKESEKGNFAVGITQLLTYFIVKLDLLKEKQCLERNCFNSAVQVTCFFLNKDLEANFLPASILQTTFQIYFLRV